MNRSRILVTIFLFTMNSYGQVFTAGSSSYSDVSAVLDTAPAGATVRVPAGENVWPSRLIIDKSVILIGAGIDKTIIKNGIEASGWGDFCIHIEPAHPADDPVIEITGFTIDANLEGGCISIMNTNDSHALYNFRIHDNKLMNNRDNGDSYMSVRIKGNCFGLIDNNIFQSNNYDFKIYGNDQNSWDRFPGPENMGTKNFVYIEDNTSIDVSTFSLSSGEGARWVYRYNTINGKLKLDAHGDTRNDGVVGHEIYENIVTNDFNAVTGQGFSHDYRGGTGIIFNNRARIGTSGVRGKIQIREENSNCADPVNNGYIWNNRNSQDNNIIAVWHDEFDQFDCIAEDTDWWDDAARTPGGESPSNFTYGPAAERPSTSADDDCYWATDERKLYRSIGNNNWTFVYEPFAYPHPLQTPTKAKETTQHNLHRLVYTTMQNPSCFHFFSLSGKRIDPRSMPTVQHELFFTVYHDERDRQVVRKSVVNER